MKATADTTARADLAYDFGARWALRHQNAELGAQLLEEALRIDPTRERAFTYLKDLHGVKGGEWERLVRLADELTDRSNLGPQAAYLLSQAGLISWKQRGDVVSAKRYFERLAGLEPDSQALLAFEAAYAAYPAPEFQYDIGLCHERLGHTEQQNIAEQYLADLRTNATKIRGRV